MASMRCHGRWMHNKAQGWRRQIKVGATEGPASRVTFKTTGAFNAVSALRPTIETDSPSPDPDGELCCCTHIKTLNFITCTGKHVHRWKTGLCCVDVGRKWAEMSTRKIAGLAKNIHWFMFWGVASTRWNEPQTNQTRRRPATTSLFCLGLFLFCF